MNTSYLSLIGDPPAGFVCGAVGKRELLSGTVVLLAEDCASACALLPDFRTRVVGVALTFGTPLITRLGRCSSMSACRVKRSPKVANSWPWRSKR